LAAKKKQVSTDKPKLTPAQQFDKARQELTELQQALYGLCITPDPVDENGKPLLDAEGKVVRAKEPTDTVGKVKATVAELNDTYKETLKDATGAAVPKTPITVTSAALTKVRRELTKLYRQMGVCVTSITDAQQSYNEQLQVAAASIQKKNEIKRQKALAKRQAADDALAQLEQAS
jgi:hypothetical protein